MPVFVPLDGSEQSSAVTKATGNKTTNCKRYVDWRFCATYHFKTCKKNSSLEVLWFLKFVLLKKRIDVADNVKRCKQTELLPKPLTDVDNGQ